MPGGPYNTHLIGKAIVEGDWRQAYKQIKITDNISPEVAINKGGEADPKKIFKLMNPKKISFFVSAYNSFLWNTKASSIINKHAKSAPNLFKNVGRLYLPSDGLFECSPICEVEGYEFIAEKFSCQNKKYKRNLVVATTVYPHNVEADELNKGKSKLAISFYLPTGSYATMIIKQIFLRLK
jgi:tRNA pseudouridine13 synthase